MKKSIIDILKEKQQPLDQRFNALLIIANRFDISYLPVMEAILVDESEHPDIRSAVALTLGKVAEQEMPILVFQESAEPEEESLRDIIFNLLSGYTDTEDVTLKNYVIQALGMMGSERVAPYLIDALKDENNVVFASAAESLGFIGRPVVPYLIEVLDEGADDARCVAAWQLGKLGYTDAIEPLLRTIRQVDNPEVVALSVWALGEIGYDGAEVLETLKWAKAHQEEDVSTRADRAIKKIARHIN
ncbi:MAG: HEAT repeat domain-containing protein [Vampirovibrio sp.]|nr:HEAT repeat domain-containing protein [Vampirovibrio sp.]